MDRIPAQDQPRLRRLRTYRDTHPQGETFVNRAVVWMGAALLLSVLAGAQPADVIDKPESSASEESLLIYLGPDTGSHGLIDSDTRARRHAEREMSGKDEAIRVGELLTFSVRYGFIRAGEASLEIEAIETIDNHPCYHVVSRAKSNGFFDGDIFRIPVTVRARANVITLSTATVNRHTS